jgi:hypothetical protein
MAERFDLFRGDATGMDIPAHPEALMAAGPEFLTRALQHFGTLAADNAITAFSAKPCPGGSTGKKLFLTLETLRPEPGLDRVVFAKFSRDFDDDRRDWQRTEMAGEARFVALSRNPDFPIRVPRGFFADYHAETGTGLVITECIAYGEGAIEPHRRKCLDWQTMADPLPYYRASVTALARLAAAHKSGRLAPDIDAQFPWDPVTGSADLILYSDDELAAELEHCRAFARDCPQLLPEEVRTPEFLAQMERDTWVIRENEAAIRAALAANPAMIALNHWNSHIDNCWFWRDGADLHCGLIDWGRVGQITFGSALWGGLSAAHHDIWDHHLDDLLTLFVREYAEHGGPVITLADLKQHLALHMAAMGVARVLAFPEIIRFRQPQCPQASGPHDPMFEPVAVDAARNCLSVYTVFLKHWRRENFGEVVRRVIA